MVSFYIRGCSGFVCAMNFAWFGLGLFSFRIASGAVALLLQSFTVVQKAKEIISTLVLKAPYQY